MILNQLSWPDNAIRCQRGDYLLRQEANGRVKAYHVEDIVKLNRLVPFGQDALVEEQFILDSNRPAYMDEIHFLLTNVEREFASFEEATTALHRGEFALGTCCCEDCRQFPPGRCRSLKANSDLEN